MVRRSHSPPHYPPRSSDAHIEAQGLPPGGRDEEARFRD